MPTNSSLDLQRFYPDELDMVSIEEDPDEIRLHMLSRSKSFCCPKCGEELRKLHATHHRTVQDLPILGKRVFLDIRVHDFQCQNPICEIGAFSETFHGFLNHYSRMTERLIDFVTILALETSCEASARIMQAMHVKISGDTVIRMLLKRYQMQSHIPCGSHIGVDDFAFKKRHTYGTIIVDENSHIPVAVLEGRDGSALKAWLTQNKQVTTVTRDCASAYAKAVEEILPDCMQIADRFHLHQNLLEAVKSVINSTVPVDIKIPKDAALPYAETAVSDTLVESSKKNV